jgi:deoxyribodipyrimidine photo-lyase
MRTLVWFRSDLRVADNPALSHAMARGEAIGVFCISTRQWRAHDVGDNRLAFVLDSLHRLAADLTRLGVPLRLVTEPWFDGLPERLTRLADELRADRVTFNEEYPLDERVRDSRVARACAAAGVVVEAWHGDTLLQPGAVLSNEGEPYTTFGAFKRRWLARMDAAMDSSAWAPLPVPARQERPDVPGSALPARTDGVPRDRVSQRWPGGSREAQRRLTAFLADRAGRYATDRDFPARDGTSMLSPYLAIGSLSARQCLQAAVDANDGRLRAGARGILAWIDELIWRDFYRHVVAQFPHVSRHQAFRREMDHLPWRHAPEDFAAWKAGRTGFPLVDAAMRQLQSTGWMHNRLRMLTAMFLCKHLLLDWRLGERHFMNLLVDGDFAANNGGWQWSASTGTDAAPYFRIFNPHTQARRFDPDGTFIRRYVPELADAPAESLFDPAGHPVAGYVRPMVDHRAARQRAIDTFRAARDG